MNKDEKVFIAGHEGMIGAAIVRKLKEHGFGKLLTRVRTELDLTDQKQVHKFFNDEKPDYVFLAVNKIGGILAASKYPAEYIYENMQSQTNVIHSAWKFGVKKLLFLASSCIYPRECPQPMKEDYLMSGKLEPTCEPYALAKIAGIRMCQSYHVQYGTKYISAVPADLYGPGDDFNLETAHVLPALLRKMHEGRINRQPQITVWGTGSPRRERLYVDDLADACLFLMNSYDKPELINIGTGEDISIGELAHLIKEVVGFQGDVVFDASKPDGTPRKLLDSDKISKLGWSPKINPDKGIRQTYQWFINHLETI